MKARNYSYNCGLPVEKLIVPTTAEIINLFDKLRRNGRVFRVDFIKRGDGTARTMLCRFGVKKYLKGGKKAYDAGDKGLFTVWDFNRQAYRSIPIDNLLMLKTGGTVYVFNSQLNAGTYRPTEAMRGQLHSGGYRTLPARTSPMYEAV